MDEKEFLTAEQTRDKALTYLEYRSHSEKELADKLRRAGARQEDIEDTLVFARRYHFVDDADYAKRLARDLKNLKKYGLQRIRQELKCRGIGDVEITEALAQFDEDSEQEQLLPLVERRLRGDFTQKSIDKAIRYFIYRGYQFSDIKMCIDTIRENNENGI